MKAHSWEMPQRDDDEHDLYTQHTSTAFAFFVLQTFFTLYYSTQWLIGGKGGLKGRSKHKAFSAGGMDRDSDRIGGHSWWGGLVTHKARALFRRLYHPSYITFVHVLMSYLLQSVTVLL